MRYAIYPEKQNGTPTATSDNVAYPWSNIIADKSRKKVGKAATGVQTVTLIQAISANSEAITIQGTNAQEVICIIKNSVGAVVESITHNLSSYKNLDRFFQIYTKQTADHTATITLTAGTGETVEAGILRAGLLTEIGNPLKKPKEKLKSYSIEEPLRNGASYGKSGEIVRTFSYSMLLDRTTKYRDLMELYRIYNPFPIAMLITDNVSDGGGNEFSIFGKIVGEPDVSMETATKNMVNISIEEVV